MNPMNTFTNPQQIKQKEYSICRICISCRSSSRSLSLIGEYRGPAYNKCNLDYQIKKFIPIFFHNLSSYDCHLFIRELSFIEGDRTEIPLSKALYMHLY